MTITDDILNAKHNSENLIPHERAAVTLSEGSYIKRVSSSWYTHQGKRS